ncbi:hypothetical protein HY992_03030 [Candidatus Micrarchaeota archaeon]|nr:hypothetical protein [Candidatus Micrarchaeota archaeon]
MAEKDVLDVVKNERSAIDRFKNQSLLRKQFGEEGLKVYSLLGEKHTVGDIISAAGISEERLVEILEFMDENSMIAVGAPSSPEKGESSVEEAGEEEKEEVAEGSVEEETEEVAAPLRKSSRGKPSVEEKSKKPVEEVEGEEKGGEWSAPEKPFGGRKPKEGKTGFEAGEAEVEKPVASRNQSLSPFEKIIFDKFGATGLSVYKLIDGERTAEEILNETGVSEVRLVEILEFMEKQGIIKLEKPKEEVVESAAPAFADEERALVDLPEPLLEEEEAPPAKVEEKIDFDEAIPIDVPIKQSMGVIQKITLEADLTRKFGGTARKVYNAIDNRKDTVSLVVETGVSFDSMDEVLAYLGQKGAALFATLSQDDVQERYGKDGLRVYDKYGREGVLLYEFIGKANSLREIVARSQLPPERAVEIFIHIHQVLGLEVPLDKTALYRELGIFKK